MAKIKKINSSEGIMHIHTTKNNTIITITDLGGNTLCWASSGTVGYKGSKKKTAFSAGQASGEASKQAFQMGLRSIKVNVKGTGQGYENAIIEAGKAGLQVTSIQDVTPIAHNGCRPPKKPR